MPRPLLPNPGRSRTAALPCCPECGRSLQLEPGLLLDGTPLHCPRCGADAIVAHEWCEELAGYRLVLLPPEEFEPDEDRH